MSGKSRKPQSKAKRRTVAKKTRRPRTKAKTVKKTAPRKAKTPKATKGSAQTQKHVQGNPYRAGSSYAVCFDTLAKMGTAKPVSRKDLLAAYAKSSGKDAKRAGYDLAVILSPTKEGAGHRSSRKMAYYVRRLENGCVQLVMAD